MSVVYYAPGPAGFLYDWHAHHFVAEFRARGIDVAFCNPYSSAGTDGVPSAARCGEIALDAVRAQLRSGPIDMFLAVATDDTITGEVVDEVRRLGVPTVNLSTDDLVVPYRIRRIAPHFDLTWTTAPGAVGVLRSYGGTVVYLPWAANPFAFTPENAEEDIAVGFLGRCYGVRAIRISQLSAAGIPVVRFDRDRRTPDRTRTPLIRAAANLRSNAFHVMRSLRFATGRKCVWSALVRTVKESSARIDEADDTRVTWAPPPPFEKVSSAYAKMAMSLGSLEVGSTYVLREPILFPRLREFEAPMCGAVHLANRTAAMSECFVEDAEMLFYSSKEEMIDKARFYLRPDQLVTRRRIRMAARRRAERDHSWFHRYEALRSRLQGR